MFSQTKAAKNVVILFSIQYTSKALPSEVFPLLTVNKITLNAQKVHINALFSYWNLSSGPAKSSLADKY
jgi:hypothetical protein